MVAGVVVLPRDRIADWMDVKEVVLLVVTVLFGLTRSVPGAQPARGSDVGAWHSARL